MSEYSPMATLQNNSQPAGFVKAVQRAKLVAAKIESGSKRSLDNSPENSTSKPSHNSEGPPVKIKVSNSPPPAMNPPLPPGPPPSTQDLQNDYIRVPDKMVGLIIGRQGEQITRLQAESGCKIQMGPESGTPDRLCTLTGTQEAIDKAKDLVHQIIYQRGWENDGPPPASAPIPRSIPGIGPGSIEEIMIPGPKVGLVIGKSGKTIKLLQEQSGAKMVVIQEGPSSDVEKPLRISGEPAKVEHAKQLVYELLADRDPFAFEDFPEEEGGVEVLVPKIAVGVVIGRSGDMIKKIQLETGCRVQFHQKREDGPGDKRCFMQGQPHQVDQAKQMVEALISSVTRREMENRNNPRYKEKFSSGRSESGRGEGGSGGGSGSGSGREDGASGSNRGNNDNNPQWENDDFTRVIFTLSHTKCGLIIGKRGEIIKQINAQTGAHCELDRRCQNSSDRSIRTFIIKGSAENVEHCKRVITDKLGMQVNFMDEGSVPNSGNGNGGNDYYGGGGNGGNGGGSSGGGNGGGNGGSATWGYNPQWHPANNQQQQSQPSVPINPLTGQPDYSAQWIEYYKAAGMMKEADAIMEQMNEQRLKYMQQQQRQARPSSPAQTPVASSSSFVPMIDENGQPDYSALWAEYYRSLGKTKEAEAIENQIKAKLQQNQPNQQSGQQMEPQSGQELSSDPGQSMTSQSGQVSQMPGQMPQMAGQMPQMPGQMPQMSGQMPQMPGQMQQMPGQMQQMPAQMQQMSGQMPQMPGQMPQMPGQMPQMPGQMPGQMSQMPGQMPQMPGQMPQMSGQMPQMPGQMPQMPGQMQQMSQMSGPMGPMSGPMGQMPGPMQQMQMPSQLVPQGPGSGSNASPGPQGMYGGQYQMPYGNMPQYSGYQQYPYQAGPSGMPSTTDADNQQMSQAPVASSSAFVPMIDENGKPDYTAQWVEYFRSIGKTEEFIANEMNNGQVQQNQPNQQMEPQPGHVESFDPDQPTTSQSGQAGDSSNATCYQCHKVLD